MRVLRTFGRFNCEAVDGHHLFLLEKPDKIEWLKRVAKVVSDVQLKPPVAANPEVAEVDSDEEDLAMFL